METAHTRDGVMKSKFWFRKNPMPPRRNAKDSPRTSTPNGAGSEAEVSGVSTPLRTPAQPSRPPTPGPVEDEYTQMSIDEIINGTRSDDDNNNNNTTNSSSTCDFPGLIPLVELYLDSVNIDVTTRCELARYLNLIRQRANGTLWTGAKWIREFVRTHADYKGDSAVSEQVVYDLFKRVEEVTKAEGSPAGKGPGWEMLTARRRAAGLDD